MAKGDWCIVSLDVSIVRIVDDNKNGKYIGRIVDAGDIIQVEK